ncbi:hypothetical protein EsH8_II_001161 [Colletotrichum jinshuiense]
MLTENSIIFIHGLRGHPRRTWESDRVEDDVKAYSTTSRKRDSMKSLFTKRSTSSSSQDNPQDASTPDKLFWPEDYLANDIPEARIWTYGYNADAISGLFQANNMNSVSQHGRDLTAKIEREIENEVIHSLVND